MIEQVYTLSQAEEKTIEKVLMDENIHYMHMLLPKGDGLPEHYTNATVYMTVARGTLSLALSDGEPRLYAAGTLLKIPFQTKMNAKNAREDMLELIVVKAPAPGK